MRTTIISQDEDHQLDHFAKGWFKVLYAKLGPKSSNAYLLYAGSLRSHSRNEAYYAKMAKHKDVIIQTGEIISSARSRLSYFRGGADYANTRQKYGR